MTDKGNELENSIVARFHERYKELSGDGEIMPREQTELPASEENSLHLEEPLNHEDVENLKEYEHETLNSHEDFEPSTTPESLYAEGMESGDNNDETNEPSLTDEPVDEHPEDDPEDHEDIPESDEEETPLESDDETETEEPKDEDTPLEEESLPEDEDTDSTIFDDDDEELPSQDAEPVEEIEDNFNSDDEDEDELNPIDDDTDISDTDDTLEAEKQELLSEREKELASEIAANILRKQKEEEKEKERYQYSNPYTIPSDDEPYEEPTPTPLPSQAAARSPFKRRQVITPPVAPPVNNAPAFQDRVYSEEDKYQEPAPAVKPKKKGLFARLFTKDEEPEVTPTQHAYRAPQQQVPGNALVQQRDYGNVLEAHDEVRAAPVPVMSQMEINTGQSSGYEKFEHKVSAKTRDDVSVQEWLQATIRDALELGASDLHITTDGKDGSMIARIRVDGKIRDFDHVEPEKTAAIMGLLKANSDFGSGRLLAPKESLYMLRVDGEERKVRSVLFPKEDGGEALVMRLPLIGPLKTLDDLSFGPKNLQYVKELLDMPYKLIMIAGPMGSGKTTTAHGALLRVASPERIVWSIEDPVERNLPNVVQLEVDEDNNAGFDVLLSKLLRADYNTLFLGEIRDNETAQAAVRQAKAGRQIISTIHADDNVKSLMRLIELAQDTPLSVLSSVGGVISQRLVRRLNPDWDGVDPDKKYKGRVPIHEILFVDDTIVETMMLNKTLSEINQAIKEAKGTTFVEDAKRLISQGVTDKEEVVSVIGDYDDDE